MPIPAHIHPGTKCGHFLQFGGREVASAWLPVEATIEEVRANCLTMTSITIHTDRGAGEIPQEREQKIRHANTHWIMYRGGAQPVDY